MKIIKFSIIDFKGIQSTEINLDARNGADIVTLIGLNESGKTTILEAISRFLTRDKYASSLVHSVHQDSSVQDLIPKHNKAAFSGNISIEATVTFEDDDKSALANMFLEKHNLILDKTRLPDSFLLETVYRFEDSRYLDRSSLWSNSFFLKSPKNKRYTEYDYSETDKDQNKIWNEGVDFISGRVPKIVYFPTFLFNLPDRIYLSDIDDNINHYYKQVIQDILDNGTTKLSIQRHIIERISRLKSSNKQGQPLYPFLLASDEKKQIDAVIQNLANEIGRIVFGSWGEILGRNVTGKRIAIDWFLDSDRDDMPYIELYIIDGQSRYSISERSLGFRWFFSFLLFTQFRRSRPASEKTIFLFDEPASNLHSKAQMKLLETFDKIAKSGTSVIYSTHSHYMINPLWLESAYIIKNEAADYDRENDIDAFEIAKTDIKAIKYRQFVGSNPNKTTYFQPVLDALDVAFSPLVRAKSALIIEGKYDYHPLAYFLSLSSKGILPDIFPANGAGHLACLISLFRGWGVCFRIILDDDAAGRRERKRYIDENLVSENEIFTIGDIVDELKGNAFDKIYNSDVKMAVSEYFGKENIDKRHYSIFFHSKIISGSSDRFVDTEKQFDKIRQWITLNYALDIPTTPPAIA